MKRIRPLLSTLCAMVLVALVLAVVPLKARAAEVIHSGTWGKCPWEITSDGVLTVHPGRGAGQDGAYRSPWYDYRESIKRVVFAEEGEARVIAPSCSNNLLGDMRVLETVDTSGLDTSAVSDMSWMFWGCSELRELDVSDWDTSSVKFMSYMFCGCSSLSSLDLSGWDTSSVRDMDYMFSECSGLRTIDVSNWDISSVKDMSNMFRNCSSLSSLDVSGWNTSFVENMYSMFIGCSSLSSLDLSGWDTSSVTEMGDLFSDCSGLMSLDLSGWDTSSVKNMGYMFAGCTGLSSLDLSGLETSANTNMGGMFAGCLNLVSLDLSAWDTSAVTNMWGMFANCEELRSLDLSGWDTSSVENMFWMFMGCFELEEIYIGDGWSTDEVSDSTEMFSGCWSIVGECGTVYDWSQVDKAYARVDTPDAPGYLCANKHRISIAGATLGDIEDHPYIGAPIKPAVTVTLDSVELAEDTDFVVRYENNIEVGTATVIITGINDYMGTITSHFEIIMPEPVPIDISGAAVELEYESAEYTGEALQPEVVSVIHDGDELVEGIDYTVGYENNVEVGLATVTVTGMGDYEGTAEATFEIVPAEEPPEPPEPPAGPFFLDADPADTTNHGAEVDWMGRSGISTGWEVAGGREFRGRLNVARCDFAAFLYRLADLSDDGARNDSIALTEAEVASVLANVKDCTPSTSHAPEIAWLISTGISKGWSNPDGTVSFRPMANVARQDMAAFLYRYADLADDGIQNQSPVMGPETVTFSDVRHGDTTNHADEVEWLASVGVTKGWDMGGGTFQFRGTRNVARQDMAAFMYRLYTYLEG